MEPSKLAKQAELALVATTQRMTPEQRLEAYLTHCRLVMELYLSGERIRAGGEQQRR